MLALHEEVESIDHFVEGRCCSALLLEADKAEVLLPTLF